ncbi:MAG: FkbM family methyltransferase [Chloroflexi bacterium]|nr:FkbM family methyltransferase [Chloroflexota bacterium]
MLRVLTKRHFTLNYYRELESYLRKAGVEDGDTIVDVGANIGYYAVAYAIMRPRSTVVALEPAAVNYELLVRNARPYPNIMPLQIGAHHESEKARMSMPSATQSARVAQMEDNTGLLSLYGESGQYAEEVELRTLDEILASISLEGRVAFVKVDVEGDEVNVLKGAGQLIARHHPVIEVEVNPSALTMSRTEFSEIHGLLAEFGYSPYVFDGDDWHPYDRDTQGGSVVDVTFLATPDRSVEPVSGGAE